MRKLVLALAALTLVAGIAACGSLGQSGGDQGSQGQSGKKMSERAKDKQIAPKKGAEKSGAKVAKIADVPSDPTLKLTVPKMERVKDAVIPTGLGTDEALLRENTAIRLKGTGEPWEEEANVYIAGHRLGYKDTRSYLAFFDIDKLENGDRIYLTDANGNKYTYEVFRTMTVEPTDLYVLDPIKGKNIVSLQACTLPDYSNRVIVQAELKDVKA